MYTRMGAAVTKLPICAENTSRKIILSGGISQPNIGKTPAEIVSLDLNEYEQKSNNDMFILIYNTELSDFHWDYITNFPTSRAFHSAFYCKSIDSIVIMGGVNVENSSLENGERIGLDPVIINLSTYVITNISLPYTSPLSGFASLQVNLFYC